MGNEQAVPQQNQGNQTGFQGSSGSIPVSSNSSQNYLLSDSFIQQSFVPDYKITIVIRGTRKTGKTTLITRIRGFAFDPEYQATPSIETTEIPWRSPEHENILVAAWDTVEHCIPKLDSINSPMADATHVDTIEKADAVVIMIDNRSEESVDLAEKLIINAADNLPVAVFSNFMDLENSSPLVPTKLMQYMGRFFFIPGSLKTNQGLIELSKWLTLPLLSAKAKQAYSLHLSLEQETKEIEAKFNKNTLEFLDLSSALSHIKNAKKENSPTSNNSSSSNEHGHTYKKAYQRRPLRRAQQNNNSTKENQQATIQNNTVAQNSSALVQNSKSTEDSFWDDDDDANNKSNTNTKSTRVIKRRVVKKVTNEDDDENEIIKPNPLVKPLKTSTNQTNLQNKTSQPTITPSTEGETTKRRKVIKRKSTNSGVSQQVQQAQQTQQAQQQQHVVRRKKKVVHHSQNNNSIEDATGNEPSVDGYESF